jgi:hypothetical protein
MTYFSRKENTNQNIASITIGSDLKVNEYNEAWRVAGLPAASGSAKERIDKLFPQADAAAYVLDVLASGEPRENVVVPLGREEEGRYLCASFYPMPAGAKPGKVKKVLMRGWETKASFLLDGSTGAVLEARGSAQRYFEQGTPGASSAAGWRVWPQMTDEEFEQALAMAERKGTHYLGRFRHRGPDGRDVELESLLMRIDAPRC